MGDIVGFPEKTDPFIEGKAICSHCRHEWEACAPAGTIDLECPECGGVKGLFKHPMGPGDGNERWECNCGCQIFMILPRSILCYECGIQQSFDDIW